MIVSSQLKNQLSRSGTIAVIIGPSVGMNQENKAGTLRLMLQELFVFIYLESQTGNY